MSLDYARIRLEHWGDWARENPAREVGFPTASIEHRIIWGFGDRTVEPENKDAEEVDQIIRQLEADLREITKFYYVRRWSMKQIAKRMHCSRPTVDKQLQLVLGFVAGRLESL